MKLGQAVTAFLGLKKNMLVLLAMVLLVGLGEKMAERFLPIYLVALGGGAFSVGLLNGMDNLLSALYSFPGGYASDRIGYKRALILFNLIAMLGYGIVILFPVWQAVIVGAVFFLSWTAISLPATMDMVASVLPRNKRTMGVSLHSLVRRIPMALGPVLGGLMIGQFGEKGGVRLAFVLALILGAISLVLQQVMIEDGGRAQHKAKSNPLRTPELINPSLRRLLVSDVLVRFCEQIPYAFAVIWCVNIHGITPFQFGILTTVEMITAMLIYIPVAYLADKNTKKPFVVATFGFFTLFPLVLLLSHSFWALVVAFVVRGMKEFGEPTRKALIIDLAPEGKKGRTFGTYYLIRDVVVSVAAFGGALLWDASTANKILDVLGVGRGLLSPVTSIASPATNLLAAFGFGLLGTLYFALFGRDLKSERRKPMKWVTREHMKVDRVACPWLIKRFIDPEAELLFVPPDEVLEVAEREGAISYDARGRGQYDHREGKCTFEVLVEEYDLGQDDPALRLLADIVHGADTADREYTPQSPGVRAIAEGFHYLNTPDEERLAHGLAIYDALYAWCRHQTPNVRIGEI